MDDIDEQISTLQEEIERNVRLLGTVQEKYQHSTPLTRNTSDSGLVHTGRIDFDGNAPSKDYVRSDKSPDTTVPVSAYRGVQKFDEQGARPRDKTYEQSTASLRGTMHELTPITKTNDTGRDRKLPTYLRDIYLHSSILTYLT